jgi:hypothetical protein
MKNISCHTDLLCELETSLLRGIQIGEMFRLGVLIGVVKQTIWSYAATFKTPVILRGLSTK